MAKTLKDFVNEILAKISIIDRQIYELESFSSKNEKKIEEIHIKLEKLKEEIFSCRNTPDLEKTISSIEKDLDKINSNLQGEINSLKMEMPEIRLIKKVVLGMIAFILTAFLGVIWNGLITPVKKPDYVDEFAKRIAEEYRKNGIPK